MAHRNEFVVFMTLALSLCGCTGTGFKLPNVSTTQVQLLEQSMAQNAQAIPTVHRTDKQYAALVSRITTKLDKVIQPVCAVAKTPSCFFNVEYVNDPMVNATTSEDHHIKLYRGLLQYLATDDEIAAVLGHEYGHVIANHVQEKKDNARIGAAIGGILTAVAVGLANRNNPYYNANEGQKAVENSMKIGAAIGAVSFSKEEEREADLLAAYLIERAGYDMDKAGRVWEVLAVMGAGKGGGGGGLFDSHPASAERMIAWDAAKVEVRASPDRLPSLN